MTIIPPPSLIITFIIIYYLIYKNTEELVATGSAISTVLHLAPSALWPTLEHYGNPSMSAEENIRQLCFKKGGLLVDEFDHLFSNIFQRRSPLYREIVKALTYGAKEPVQLAMDLGVELSGLFSEYLEELALSGFIKRDYTWHVKTGQDSKLSKYRLSDNYTRFYLRYIEKYRTKIDRGGFEFKSLMSLPEWNTIMGLQFENLILNNRKLLHDSLGISQGYRMKNFLYDRK